MISSKKNSSFWGKGLGGSAPAPPGSEGGRIGQASKKKNRWKHLKVVGYSNKHLDLSPTKVMEKTGVTRSSGRNKERESKQQPSIRQPSSKKGGLGGRTIQTRIYNFS